MVAEYPVFIPFDGDHLSGVLTQPEREPRGLVLLMTGIGATRSHRFRLWTRTARRLAVEQDVASLRLDYQGIGDSTGDVREWTDDSTYGQAREAVTFGLRATGASSFAAAGNCLGGRHALRLAGEMPNCVGAVCIRAMLTSADASGAGRAGTAARLATASRKRLRRLRGRPGARAEVMDELTRTALLGALEHARVLFLYSEENRQFLNRAGPSVEQLLSGLPEEQRERFALRVFPGTSLEGFRTLEMQELTIDSVLGWMASSFSAAPSSSID
ncbi:MAG: alpha/beta hydrolase [Actinomycetota bacterium]